MLENAVGEGICGGVVKSVESWVMAGCEGETLSPQPAYFHNMQIYFTFMIVIWLTILINSVQNRR